MVQHVIVNDDIHAATKTAASEAKMSLADFVDKWLMTNPAVKAAYKRLK